MTIIYLYFNPGLRSEPVYIFYLLCQQHKMIVHHENQNEVRPMFHHFTNHLSLTEPVSC